MPSCVPRSTRTRRSVPRPHQGPRRREDRADRLHDRRHLERRPREELHARPRSHGLLLRRQPRTRRVGRRDDGGQGIAYIQFVPVVTRGTFHIQGLSDAAGYATGTFRMEGVDTREGEAGTLPPPGAGADRRCGRVASSPCPRSTTRSTTSSSASATSTRRSASSPRPSAGPSATTGPTAPASSARAVARSAAACASTWSHLRRRPSGHPLLRCHRGEQKRPSKRPGPGA